MKRILFAVFFLLGQIFAQTNVAHMLSGVNYQTGTSYSFVGVDNTRLTSFANAGAVAVCLSSPVSLCNGVPAGSSAFFAAGSIFDVINTGAGTVTVTCSSCTISGNTTLSLTTGQSAELRGDGVNFAVIVFGSGPGGNAFLGGNNNFTGTNTFSNINNVIHVGGNTGLSLTAGIALCPVAPAPCVLVIDGSITFSSALTLGAAQPITLACGGSDVNANTAGTTLTYTPAGSGTTAITFSNITRNKIQDCNIVQGNAQANTNGVVFSGTQGGSLVNSQIHGFTGVGFTIADSASSSGEQNVCLNSEVGFNGTGLLLTQSHGGKAVNQNAFYNCNFHFNSTIQIQALGNVSESGWYNYDISGLTDPLVQLGDGVNFCRGNNFFTGTMESTNPLGGSPPANQRGILNQCLGTWVHSEGGLAGVTPIPIVDGALSGNCHWYHQSASNAPDGTGQEVTCPPVKNSIQGGFSLGASAPFNQPGVNAPSGWSIASTGTTKMTVNNSGIGLPYVLGSDCLLTNSSQIVGGTLTPCARADSVARGNYVWPLPTGNTLLKTTTTLTLTQCVVTGTNLATCAVNNSGNPSATSVMNNLAVTISGFTGGSAFLNATYSALTYLSATSFTVPLSGATNGTYSAGAPIAVATTGIIQTPAWATGLTILQLNWVTNAGNFYRAVGGPNQTAGGGLTSLCAQGNQVLNCAVTSGSGPSCSGTPGVTTCAPGADGIVWTFEDTASVPNHAGQESLDDFSNYVFTSPLFNGVARSILWANTQGLANTASIDQSGLGATGPSVNFNTTMNPDLASVLALPNFPATAKIDVVFSHVLGSTGASSGINTATPGYVFSQAWANSIKNPWVASATMLSSQYIWDGSHFQQITSAGSCVLGTSVPAFNHAGSTTADGTCTWTDKGTTNAPPQDAVGGCASYGNATMAALASGVYNVNTQAVSDLVTSFPVTWETPYLTAFQQSTTALVAALNTLVYVGRIDLVRPALGAGGEHFGWCTSQLEPPAGGTAANFRDVWQTMVSAQEAPYLAKLQATYKAFPIMSSFNGGQNGVQTIAVADSLGSSLAAAGLGVGSQGLSSTDPTNYPNNCGQDACNINDTIRGQAPFTEGQTSGVSDPTNVNSPGSLATTLNFWCQWIDVREPFAQDWLIAFDPNYSAFATYGGAYLAAFQNCATGSGRYNGIVKDPAYNFTALKTIPTVSAVDGLCLTPSATGAPGTVNIAACGSDATIKLNLSSKGGAGVTCDGAACGGAGGANTALSNLAAVAVNLALLPGADNSISLDGLSNRYINLWLSGVMGWTNGAGTQDTGLSRDAAGVTDVGNGTTGDKSGTLNATKFAAVGTNGGIAGTEGTGANAGTPGAGTDIQYPDSTNHCWHYNDNNLDIGCSVAGGTAAVTSGDLACYNGTTGFRIQDCNVAGTNVVTAASAAGAAKQTCVSSGASKTCTYIDFPDTKSIPFAICVNGTAATGVSTTTAVGGTCRAGTNNKDAFLGPFTTSDTATFKVHLPKDWDTGTAPSLSIDMASTDATNGHTIILQAQTACSKLDGSTTDDVAFNATQAMSTITLGAGGANQTWTATLSALTTTGCSAPGILWVKITRTTDTATNVELYEGDITIPRLLTMQAN